MTYMKLWAVAGLAVMFFACGDDSSSAKDLEVTFGTMIDRRDDKEYKTVTIGSQTWMAENLNYADSVATASLKGKSWCYNNESKNCDEFGRLYTWAAAIDSVKLATDAAKSLDCGFGKACVLMDMVQGICPRGWHLPTYREWDALLAAVGGESTAGEVLKSQEGWYDNGNGTDSFGFSALPAGRTNGEGDFLRDGTSAYFWSSSADRRYYAYYVGLNYYDADAILFADSKHFGFSVRCIKDEE